MIKPLDIAIDFDGTVVTHEFPAVGKDIGAEPVLKRMVAAGHRLILYTMRGNVTDNTGHSGDPPVILNGNFLDDAVKWFIDREIPLYGIQTNPGQAAWTTSPKCYAHLYIDDAALGVPLAVDPELSARPFVHWPAVENLMEMYGHLPGVGYDDKISKEDPGAVEAANFLIMRKVELPGLSQLYIRYTSITTERKIQEMLNKWANEQPSDQA